MTLGHVTSFSRIFLQNLGCLLSHAPGSQFSAQQGPPSFPPAPASSAGGSLNSALPSPATLQGYQSPQHCLHCLYPSHPPGGPPGGSWQQTAPHSPSTVWSPVLAACTPQWTCEGTSSESPFANMFGEQPAVTSLILPGPLGKPGKPSLQQGAPASQLAAAAQLWKGAFKNSPQPTGDGSNQAQSSPCLISGEVLHLRG